MSDRVIHRLHRKRPRSRFARWSGLALVVLAVYAWSSDDLKSGDLFSERRLANLQRFLGELLPYPLQEQDLGLWQSASVTVEWAVEALSTKGLAAAGITLALAVAAIVLAALGALTLAVPAARTLATPEPYLPDPRTPGRLRRAGWWLLVTCTRIGMIFVRSIPEYVWAFVFLAMLGPTAWPVVLALALHNLGILGKLTSEVIENLDRGPLASLRGLGATRSQIATSGVLPLILPRFLLFFFYRWETCVREATVLGMLGIVSLGYWIIDSRARNHYDEMFFLVLLGAGIVLIGDLVSALAREIVRRAA
ncbi:MAG: ABC transporter permease subunit [Thermoanaerobaculia bacterium]